MKEAARAVWLRAQPSPGGKKPEPGHHIDFLAAAYSIPAYSNPVLQNKPAMGHVIRDKQKLLNRVRRIRGQVEAIERALDGEAGCAQIMHQIAGCRGAINSLLVEVVEDHIRTHLVDPAKNPEALDAEAAAQLIEVVHSYFR